MSLHHKFRWTGWVVLLLFFVFNITTGYTQSPEIDNLLIEVWPEYDRPEPLIIYRAELNPNITLPASITFQLPGYIENMHAVAVENNGSLFSVSEDEIELNHQGDTLQLTFPATTPVVYFEYYDPQILTKQAQDRELQFSFSPLSKVNTFTFQIQEPFGAENFQLDPPASDTFVNNNGLNYNRLTITGMAPGNTFVASATYQRNTDLPSVQMVDNVSEHAESPSQPAVNVITESEVSLNSNFNIGYILIGTGVLLLLGVGVYWWFSNRKQAPPPQPRQASRKKPSAARRTKKAESGTVDEAGTGFCHKCGTPLRADSNFCHHCGTERRRE